MTERILCVDDDPNILEAYKRALRKRFPIETALCAQEGLRAIVEHGPYAVVVADMRMPQMNGVEFLAKVKELAPSTVRMMLTGNADQQTALEAVNEGQIFRFMTKPCAPEVFGKVLDAGLEQYRLIMSEKDLLGNTLRGSIKVLSEVLSLTNPVAFGRASRVHRLVGQLCKELRLDRGWLIEIAALLSQIGCVAIPEETLVKVYQREPLSPAEQQAYERHPEIATALLGHIPRLEEVSEIIAHQNDQYSLASAVPDTRRAPDAVLGSRILKLALDWDALVSNGMSNELAVAEIIDRCGWYDPRVLDALTNLISVSATHVVKRIGPHELLDGMILADDVRSVKGTLLCAKGQQVTRSMRACLRNHIVNVGVQLPIKVFVPKDPTEQPARVPEKIDPDLDQWLKQGVME